MCFIAITVQVLATSFDMWSVYMVCLCIYQDGRMIVIAKEGLQVFAASFGVDLRACACLHVRVCFLKLAPCAKTA